ncbi:hypothetical protein O181_124417 [Austropuccinia psidii MF-1]|uniref:Uncharacterized protein n=1 Tax=Austropuccinia psidii MF-1 TaxID=1389203 RepID=A0A9Q3KS13_9BASI|nr:hypothetical protein [Austropuccinia psidii MF-1]
METCAVSKLKEWKELPVEKKPSSNNQAILEEHAQIFKEEEIKESEAKVEIQEELASNDKEDIKPKSKEINLTGVKTPRRENRNTCSQITQAINRYNFRNPEEIKRKPLTKLLSPIKASKSLSKGIFKNNFKSSIKPNAAVINVTAESRDLKSKPNTSELTSLKEISLKYKIIISQDLKPQDNIMFQEESID